MRRNWPKAWATAGAAVLIFLPAMFAQTAKPAKSPAAPDITGVWIIDQFHPALFPKGTTPPLTPWGEAQFKKADTLVNDPNLACLPEGIPRIMAVPLPMQFFQVPDMVLIYIEAGNQLRQIHLNRGHRDDVGPTYNGDSIGKWDGDTLVIDTVGFNDRSWLFFLVPHTEMLRETQRLRRPDLGHLEIEATYDDPGTFKTPAKFKTVNVLVPDEEVNELVCENNQYTEHVSAK